ncbi:Guanylate-kinase-associated protein (GKAP) protein [Mactra antiquata]
MPLHGPASVLDSREINKDTTTHVVRDRLTRHQNPARSSNRYSYTSDEGSEEGELITPRIPQPYKTSFSAIAPPQRVKRDRSRSTSPCTSSLKGSNRSRSKSPGGRRAHKHVTYDENVVIRDSDTCDSIITHLSDRDLSDSDKCEKRVNMSNSSQRDYSSELRELSQQIVREYSGLNNEESSSEIPSHNEKKMNGNANTPNGNAKVGGPVIGSRNPRQNVQIYKDGNKGKKIVVNEDYDHDRSVSYRVAIKNHYSDEIKQQADEIVNTNGGISLPEPESAKVSEKESRPRRCSEPTENGDHEPSRLTPAKRSISASIGNFFRRLSPHLGRKNKKGNLSNASSQSLSPGDDYDGSFQRHSSTSSLSRGKLRRSLMKLMGKSSKKSFHKSESSFEDLNQSNNSREREPQSAPKSSLYMKSIEQSSKTDKDIYQKFKEKQTTPKSAGESKSIKPMKVTSRVTSHDYPSTAETSITSSISAEALNTDRVVPPDSLDVRLVPKSIRSLQASQISTISGDDSIGECSIDPNLTGSEPSLLSETSGSKQVEVSHTSQENVTSSQNQSLSNEFVQNEAILQRTESDSYRIERKRVKELKLSYPQMPIIADSSEYIPRDIPPRTPSYLRISSAVSGYGHYSKYSAYKGIEKRSPYSSTLSLRSSRSDLTTPLSPVEMPIGKIPNIQPPTNYPPMKAEILSPKTPTAVNDRETNCESILNGANTVINSHVNGDTGCDLSVNGENGHVIHVGNFVSTGDINKDADYFLGVAQIEEDRLLMLCSKCEMELLSETISEEASGKIRAAVGKANLLISQKFRQFQDLCQQHKNPIPDSKETKCEDLQGFWEMVKLQVDDVDDMFTEIDMMRQNGWREIKIPSRRSSSSSRSSPKSSSLNVSNASTPSHTPGSRRRANRVKDTPESSPERSQKAKMAAKIRDDARKKMLAEKRAAMKQQRQQETDGVEIYVADKSDSPGRTSGSDGAEA